MPVCPCAPLCFVRPPRADSTETDVPSYGRVTYLFQNEPVDVSPLMVGVDTGSKYVVYNWYTGTVVALSASTPVAPGYEGQVYAVVAPVLPNGWAFIGEVDKYVTAAKLRIASVEATADGLTATVVGVANESVKVCAANKDGKLVCQTAVFTTGGTKTVTF